MDMQTNLRLLIDSWYDDWFAMDRLYYEWARRHGITGTVLFTLYAINVIGDSCTLSQIVSRLALSKQTVGSALDSLEKDGLITRGRDMADQRSRIVRLTPAGRAFADELLGELEAAEQAAFASLGEDLQTMIELNKSLARALRQELADE